MRRPRDYTCYLIDIEGVLVRDKKYEAVPGSCEWYAGLQEKGIRHCLVSNNTTHTPTELCADLDRAGFKVLRQRLVTTLEIGAELLTHWHKKRILWLGDERLREYWQEQGFVLVTGGASDAVVLGANTALQVADLDQALPALREHGAELVALHRNPFFLDREGQPRLGPGAWCAALEAANGGERAICVGKPEKRIYREALKRIGAEPSEVLFISDDPLNDLLTAKRLGMGTAFVLSGKYEDEGVLGQMDQLDWPDIICDKPADLWHHLPDPDRPVDTRSDQGNEPR